VGSLIQLILRLKILGPILKPLFRLLLGIIAIPIFRFFLRHILRIHELDEELEKDLEQWFKGSLVLLAASKNLEYSMFSWVDQLMGTQTVTDVDMNNPWVTGLRIMMAIGVIEMMPDQELFAIIHPGPTMPKIDRKKGIWWSIKTQCRPFVRGVINQHLNRSSPVFAILCTIFAGTAGWVCFAFAIIQYLIIGLITSKDNALDALSEFDRQVAIRRQQLKDEFEIDDVAAEQERDARKPHEESLPQSPARPENVQTTAE